MGHANSDTIVDGIAESASSEPGPIPACPICGCDQGWRPAYRVIKESHEPIFGDRFIALCSECGFGNSQPNIPNHLLAQYYASDFAPRFRGKVAKGEWPILDERSVAQISLARLFCHFEAGDGFLDLGPGAGVSFFTASQLLPEPKMFGVEMNEEMIDNIGKRIPDVRFAPDIEGIARIKDAPIRLALTSHSLEHFNGDGVIDALRDVYTILEYGGTLFVEVPHWDLREFDKRRNDVPHLCFFSKDSLDRALRAAGFEIELIRTFGIPRGAPKTFESQRRKDCDPDLVKGDAGRALLLANSPDNMPRDGGKILRAIARKRGRKNG
ncbi:class I SAM-dependent methyltransferase [Parasphingopyxis algicola]|uniref:methyltransferase domain-containing protein n=1 Tax=Parasphingopyxis algicola TaxID=2026624 RepID=UPI00159FC431|nr:methyltransferase domain-containing protein [Parasphingopyxis algicola]QLC26648.1 class I SAM-dependent methyltransferase [Parasphingopyxis algicola]